MTLFFLASLPAMADDPAMETFDDRPQDRWRFFTDRVMGGVSDGSVAFLTEGGNGFARLSGRVSTANNGGFVQMQTRLDAGAPPGAAGVRLVVRGDGQRYFVHLRDRGTRRPWHYYRASFPTTAAWDEIRIPFEAFEFSGAGLSHKLTPGSLVSLGIVAFGRDHEALVEVSEVSFY